MAKVSEEEMKKILADKGVFIESDDRSCGCCGYSTLKIKVDGEEVVMNKDVGGCNFDNTNLE